MDLNAASAVLETALTTENELRAGVIESGSWGDLAGRINAELVGLYLTEDEWDGDAPFSPFQERPLLPPTTVAFKAKAKRKLAPRQLFKAEQYAAEDVGGVVRCYVGEPKKNSETEPKFALDLASVGGTPRIVAVHEVCWKCKGLGTRDGGPCDFTDYGGATCVDGLMFKGGLSFDAGDRGAGSTHSTPKTGWEALMER